jgi:hypothetical protein
MKAVLLYTILTVVVAEYEPANMPFATRSPDTTTPAVPIPDIETEE